jgi:hypothetical protein
MAHISRKALAEIFAAKDGTRKKLLCAGELVLRFASAPTG